MRGKSVLAAVVMAACAAYSQTAPDQGYRAELSIPFGVVQGLMVVSGDHLIFIDEQQMGKSFAVYRPDVADLRADGANLVLELKKPIKDRSGERSQLSFRLADRVTADPMIVWWKTSTAALPGASSRAGTGVSPQADGETATFQVRHKHTLGGGCTGRLMITEDRINYESVTDLSHSRQWSMSDIKEIRRGNPYELGINPFTGGNYDFELQGKGMDEAQYQSLVGRIAGARGRQRP